MGNANKLSEYVLGFLTAIVKSDSVLMESDSIIQLCRGLRDFQDEVDEKMAKLEKAVSVYINRANEVFYFTQDEI